jgi:hypothetical protein
MKSVKPTACASDEHSDHGNRKRLPSLFRIEQKICPLNKWDQQTTQEPSGAVTENHHQEHEVSSRPDEQAEREGDISDLRLSFNQILSAIEVGNGVKPPLRKIAPKPRKPVSLINQNKQPMPAVSLDLNRVITFPRTFQYHDKFQFLKSFPTPIEQVLTQ